MSLEPLTKSSFAVRDLNPFTQLSEVFAVAKQRSLFLVGFFYFLPFAQLIGIGGGIEGPERHI